MTITSIFDTKLTEFNPGLFYGFDPEASLRNLNVTSMAYTYHAIHQKVDVYCAYLYAQETILPALRAQNRVDVTAEHVLTWLNQLHFRIAHTIAKDIEQPALAGAYTNETIQRWQATVEYRNELLRFRVFQDLQRVDKMDGAFNQLNQLAEEAGITVEETRAFIQLLETKVGSDESSPVPDERIFFKGVAVKLQKGFLQLSSYYHANKFTPEEKKLVDKIVTIGLPFEQIPQKMQEFAQQLIKKWKSCDKNNLDDVVELAFFTFFNITEIHPYFNANGRTATCFMNIILRSMGYPSILLRYPEERSDPNSSYSQAIKHIYDQPQLLKDHIKERIKKEDKQAYEDKFEQSFIETMGRFFELFDKAPFEKKTNLMKDANKFINKIYQKCDGIMDPQAFAQDSKRGIIDQGARFIETLTKKYFTQTSIGVVPSCVTKKYSDAEKQEIQRKLSELSGQTTWQCYNTPKEGFIILLTLPVGTSSTELTTRFNQTGILKAESMKNAKTGEAVIKLTNVNIPFLLQLESLPVALQSQSASISSSSSLERAPI